MGTGMRPALFSIASSRAPISKTNSIFLGRQARGSLCSPATGRLLHRHVMHSRREFFAMTFRSPFFSFSFLFYLIPDPFTTTPLDPNKALRLLARTKMSAWKNRLLVLHETFHASGDYTSPVVFCRPFRYPGLPSSSDSADSALDDAPVALYFFFFSELHHSPFSLCLLGIGLFFFFFFSFLFLLCILFFTGSSNLQKASMSVRAWELPFMYHRFAWPIPYRSNRIYAKSIL